MVSRSVDRTDLNYLNPLSRCNKEKLGGKDVAIKALPDNFGEYDTVLIGFPIWYGGAPGVVNSFCQKLDFTGKKVAVFATSAASPIGKTVEKLSPYIKGADIIDGKMLNEFDIAAVTDWIQNL